MKWQQWLEKWGMSSLKITPPFLEMEFAPQDYDRNAAWELYIELLTRIATQSLDDEYGDEKTALNSIFSLFDITRQVLKNHSRHCNEFAKIAIVVLNQVIRPFTAKWYKLSLSGCFDDVEQCKLFRQELSELQIELRKYTKMLADMAGVEDLTNLESYNENIS